MFFRQLVLSELFAPEPVEVNGMNEAPYVVILSVAKDL